MKSETHLCFEQKYVGAAATAVCRLVDYVHKTNDVLLAASKDFGSREHKCRGNFRDGEHEQITVEAAQLFEDMASGLKENVLPMAAYALKFLATSFGDLTLSKFFILEVTTFY